MDSIDAELRQLEDYYRAKKKALNALRRLRMADISNVTQPKLPFDDRADG